MIIEKYGVLYLLKNLMLVVIGTLILAFGTAVFVIPYDLIAGGVSGIAIVIEHVIPDSITFISIDMIITALTWILYVVGALALGKSFALKTLVSAIVYPPMISLFMHLASPDVLGGYFYLKGAEYPEIAFTIAAVAGGVMIGVGCALTFLGGGSTGGVDVAAFIICKMFPRLKSSKVIFAVDATIVVLGMVAVADLTVSMLGILCALVAALFVDKVFLGGKQALVAYIISSEHEKINRLIIERLDRTTTIVNVVGGYTLEGKKMLITSFNMSQYTEIINVINQADKNAFVTVHRAYEINGEGWTR